MSLHHRHIVRILSSLLAAVVLYACHIDHYGPEEECDHTVRLFYHYNRENTSRENELPSYVKGMTEYLFDGDGILYQVNPVEIDECNGHYASERNLPPGRYTVITMGNQTSMSETTDKAQQNAPQIGITKREDMLLSLRNETQSRSGRGYYDNCGRLFHGYRTFTVTPNDISHVRVDMVHSHCVINYTIRWKNIASTPSNTRDFTIRMGDLPSIYNLMPQYYYPDGVASEHDPATCDAYNPVCLGVIHHIPTVYKPGVNPVEECNLIHHRTEGTMLGRRITGKTITYRLRNEGDVKLSLHCESGGQLMKDLPINKILQDLGENLDYSLRQEYDLVFEIDDNGSVRVFFAGAAEWDEGGGLI